MYSLYNVGHDKHQTCSSRTPSRDIDFSDISSKTLLVLVLHSIFHPSHVHLLGGFIGSPNLIAASRTCSKDHCCLLRSRRLQQPCRIFSWEEAPKPQTGRVHCLVALLLRTTAGYVVGLLPMCVSLLSLSCLHGFILEIDQSRKQLFSCRHDVLPWINTEKPGAPLPCAK